MDPAAKELGKKLTDLKIVDAVTLVGSVDESIADAQTLLNQLQVAGSITQFQSEMIQKGTVEDVRFDDYVLLDKLGEGGMGAVYKARSTVLDRIEAIKMMTRMEDPSIKMRFQREAKLLARLEHPAIVPIYKVGRAGNVDYIAMKYVEGEDLKTKVETANEKGELLPVWQVCKWIQRAADALHHAHEQNIIHRDVKPHNLMITHSGDLIVLDMGIARFSETTSGAQTAAGMTVEGSGMGTPDYMPPEQWADARSVTPAADIYALGCTLFYALTGRVPYPRERLHEIMRAHSIDPIPSAHQLRPEIPIELDKVIERMLGKLPEDRYASAMEVVEALEPFTVCSDELTTVNMNSPKIPSRSRTADDRESGQRPSIGAIAVAVMLFLAVLGGLGTVLFIGGTGSEPVAKLDPKPDDPGATASVIPAVPTTAKEEKESKEEKPAPKEEIPDWITKFQKDNSAEWPQLEELVQAVRGIAGKASIGESATFLQEGSPLLAQTNERRRARVQEAARKWFDQIVEENKDLWVNEQEPALLVDALAPIESLETDRDFEQFQNKITTEINYWRRPFDSLRGDVIEPGWLDRVSETLQQILSLHSLRREQNWQVIAGFENDKQERVTQVTVDQGVALYFIVTEPSYVTAVMFDEHNLFVFPIQMRWEPGDAIALSQGAKFYFDEPGEKTIIVYATNEPVLSEPILPSDITSEKSRPMESIFPSKLTFEHVRRCLESGKAIPGIPPSTKAKHWAQTFTKLKVTKK